jgi:hypothetical protein
LPLDPGTLEVILADFKTALIVHMDDKGKLKKKRVFAKRDVGPTVVAKPLAVLSAFPAALLLPFVVPVKLSAETVEAEKPGLEPAVYPVSRKPLYDLKVMSADPFHIIT